MKPGAILLVCALSLAGEAWAGPKLAVGDACEAKRNLKMSAKPRGKGKKSRISKGARVDLLSEDRGWLEVTANEKVGYIKARLLTKQCLKIEAPPEPPVEEPAVESVTEPEPAVEPSPPSPPVETEPVAEVIPSPEPAAQPEAITASAPLPQDIPSDKVKVAVMDVRGSGDIPEQLLGTLTTLIPSVLDELGPFKAISTEDIRQMLAMEAFKQSVGCDDISCFAEIGGAIGADYLVSSSVADLEGDYLLQLQLINIKEARVAQRVSRKYSGGRSGLFDEAAAATKMLVREILAQKSGTLLARVSEEGATVKVDGTIIGVSPLEGRKVAGGFHTLSVEREGFVRYTVDFEISAGEETTLEVRLLPSEEFKRKYTEKASFTRVLAWSFIGTGVVGLGGGTAFYLVANSKASDLRDRTKAYNQAGATDPAVYDDIVKERKSLGTLDGLAVGAWAVGAIAGGIGAWLYFSGDDPDRYDVTTSSGVISGEPAPSWFVGAAPGSIVVGGSF